MLLVLLSAAGVEWCRDDDMASWVCALMFVGMMLITIGFVLTLAGWLAPPSNRQANRTRLVGALVMFTGVITNFVACYRCAVAQRRCCHDDVESSNDVSDDAADGAVWCDDDMSEQGEGRVWTSGVGGEDGVGCVQYDDGDYNWTDSSTSDVQRECYCTLNIGRISPNAARRNVDNYVPDGYESWSCRGSSFVTRAHYSPPNCGYRTETRTFDMHSLIVPSATFQRAELTQGRTDSRVTLHELRSSNDASTSTADDTSSVDESDPCVPQCTVAPLADSGRSPGGADVVRYRDPNLPASGEAVGTASMFYTQTGRQFKVLPPGYSEA